MSTTCGRVVLGMLVLASCGCRPPTEVMVVITTNVECSKLSGTAILVGHPDKNNPDYIEKKLAATITTTCEDGRIGSIVLIPGKDREAPFAVKILSGVDVLADDCVTSPKRPTDVKGQRGCIVARRELGFIPQTPLTLPILMRQACIGVPCAPGLTCVENGACVSDKVVDPFRCSLPGGCDETALEGQGSANTSSSSSGMTSGTGGMGGMGPTGPSSSSATSGTGGMGGMGGNAAAGSSSGFGGAGGTGPMSGSSSAGVGGAGGTGPMSGSSSAGVGGAGGTGPMSSSSSSAGSSGTGGTGPMSSSSSSAGSSSSGATGPMSSSSSSSSSGGSGGGSAGTGGAPGGSSSGNAGGPPSDGGITVNEAGVG
ncbi:MAG: hypothetical protein QM820_48630 [Minicystis sp.]